MGGYFESAGFFHDGIFTLEATRHADCSVDAVNLQRYAALTNAGANAWLSHIIFAPRPYRPVTKQGYSDGVTARNRHDVLQSMNRRGDITDADERVAPPEGASRTVAPSPDGPILAQGVPCAPSDSTETAKGYSHHVGQVADFDGDVTSGAVGPAPQDAI